MLKKIISKFFVFAISGIIFSIIGLLLYFCFLQFFYTIKNWNNLENGKIVKVEFKKSESNGTENYWCKIYSINKNENIFRAKGEIETDYQIGDKVLYQLKGKKTKWIAKESVLARIIYVNGKKVDNRINGTEIFMILFSSLILLIIFSVIYGKIKHRKRKLQNLE